MKCSIIAALVVAAVAVPSLAEAKVTRTELRGDHREVRQERRDLRQDLRQHDLCGSRDEHRELRDAKRDLHKDKRAFRRQHHRGK